VVNLVPAFGLVFCMDSFFTPVSQTLGTGHLRPVQIEDRPVKTGL
jgi:hypothetical protein